MADDRRPQDDQESLESLFAMETSIKSEPDQDVIDPDQTRNRVSENLFNQNIQQGGERQTNIGQQERLAGEDASPVDIEAVGVDGNDEGANAKSLEMPADEQAPGAYDSSPEGSGQSDDGLSVAASQDEAITLQQPAGRLGSASDDAGDANGDVSATVGAGPSVVAEGGAPLADLPSSLDEQAALLQPGESRDSGLSESEEPQATGEVAAAESAPDINQESETPASPVATGGVDALAEVGFYNADPTDISLQTGGSVNEGAGPGSVVATLATSDPDSSETFRYQLTDPSGNFEIIGNQIIVKQDAVLNYEDQSSFDVIVQVIDSGGNTYTETVTLNINDLNEGPTDISLTGGNVDENAAAGTVVANLSASDPDANETFSYQLTDASGNFEIVGDQIVVKQGASLDYEANQSFDVDVQVTDSAGNSYTETVTLNVNDINEDPTDITLTGGNVDENAAAGTVVANLSTVDPDANETFSYQLTDASGNFEIVGDQIVVKQGASLDYEANQSFDVDVQVTDSAGNSYTETVTLNVNDINEDPTDITLTGGNVDENAAAGTVVANLSTVDPDANETFSYQLTDASGNFEIVGDQIVVKQGASLDYEANQSFDVDVQVTDSAGNSYTETVTLNVNDINEDPTDITLTGGNVDENAAAGTVVANLSTVDPDANETFSYQLTDASGNFEIVGDQIVVKQGASLDYEANQSFDVDVQVTDSAGNSYTETVTLNVNDINEDPTDITLTGGNVDENAAAGTVVANLSTVDPDANETFSYQLTDASGNFEIVGDQIVVKQGASLDYEANQSFDVDVQVTDSAGNSYTETVTLNVNDINEDPTDITLTGGNVDENAAAGTVVANLSTVDPDANETFSYQLTDASGNFEIVGDQIVVKQGASLNYEANQSFDVDVQVTDSAGNSYTETVTLNVNDINEDPTDITLTGGNVDENAAAGTVVANLSTVDPDANETFSYQLTDASGNFEIVGDQIVVKQGASLDYEANQSFDVDVQVTDSAGNSYTETVTLNVNDINEDPTDITLTGGNVDENAAAGTVVANLSTVDPDANETFSYQLTDASGNFEIVGDQIVVKQGASLDYEANQSFDVDVQVTDSAGNSYTETVTLNVNDINEDPTDITLTGGNVDENAAAGTVVANLSTVDPDANETFSYQLTDASGNFEIVGDQIVVKQGASLDYEANQSFDVDVQVTDSAGNSYTETVTLSLNDLNEGPTDISLTGGAVDENASAGTVVANLSASDPDSNESFTYQLTDPSGKFEVVGDQIVVKPGAVLDYEAQTSFDVDVQVTDSGGNTYTETVTLNVNDLNEGPTDISLSGSSVDENASAGTVVANLSASDPDSNETFSYQLTDPSGNFEVVGDQIVVKQGASLDYEADASFDVDVQVTDSAGNTYTETVSLNVNDLNEGPTDISLTGGSVDENASAGTVVANLSATDPDASESFSYQITDPSGNFEVIGDQIVVKQGASLNYEADSSFDVDVQVTDSAGNTYTETVTLNVNDLNEGPTDISLTGGAVDENSAAGTVVANLSAADPDANESFSYQLTDPSGNFELSGDQIVVKEGASLNYEANTSFDVDVQVTDSGGNSYSETVTLSLNDLNEGPTDISLTGGSVDENASAGTVVANLSAADSDASESFSYQITDPSGNFEVVGDQIVVKQGASLDYEADASFDVDVQVTDSAGNTYTETVTLNVNDLNEGPTDISLTGGAVDENSAAGTVVANLSAADPDANETFTYQLTDPSGNFEVVGDQVVVKQGVSLDYESDQSFDVDVQVTDSGGNTYSETVTLSLNDLNEGPTDISLTGGSVDENASAGTVVANLSAADPDANETFTYQLTDPSGNFEVVGDQIVVKLGASLDYEAQTSFDVDVRVTDSGGNTYTETVTLSLNDLNEDPTDISLSGGSVDENASAGTVVANLSASDPDSNETFSYQLTDPSGNFEVNGDQIVVKEGASLDYEAQTSFDVDVQVTDSGGNSYTETVTLNVNDLNEAVDLRLVGTNNADVLTGGDGNDFIEGKSGNDDLSGGKGDDVFYVAGDDGLDQIDGGEGTDTIQGSKWNDVIRVESGLSNLDSVEAIDGGRGYDTIRAGSGNDTLDFSEGPALSSIEKIDAGKGDDTVIGSDRADTIEGGQGNDDLSGGKGDDVFYVAGDDGLDQIDGGEGTDTIQGSKWNDTIRVESGLSNLDSVEAIDGGGGYDTIRAGSGNDTLDFSEGPALSSIEKIDAGKGDDTVIGSDRADTIEGGQGNDDLSGGKGDDVFYVAGDDGLDQIDGGEGTDTIQGSKWNDTIRVESGLSNLDSVEAIDGGGGYDTIRAGSGNDTLDFSEGPALNSIEKIDAGKGDDTVIGSDRADTIEGGQGNDDLSGGKGDDVFYVAGDDGLDQMDGGEGTDTIQGSKWNDTIRVESNLSNLDSIEAIDGGGGYDTILGTSGNDNLDFSQGPSLSNIEKINAGKGDDTVIGTDQSDTIEGGQGNDDLSGGKGDDTFYVAGDDGLDQMDGGEGTDTIQGSKWNDTIRVESNLSNLDSIEAIDGGGGYDTILGTSGNDNLDFSQGPSLNSIERIDAGKGDDVITGSSQNDTVLGGDGSDTYVFNPFDGNDYFDGGSGGGGGHHGMMGGGGWTDTIQLDASADPGADPGDPWTITVNGVEAEYDLAAGALELNPDSAGVITMSDGSELTFDGVERIIW